MSTHARQPGVEGLGGAVDALREWQDDAAPFQLHPGDVGWFWRFGAEATAAAVRTWSRDGAVLAVGLLDGPSLLRLGIAPEARRDDDLARQLVADTSAVLPPGANAGGVATYESAGYRRLPERLDLRRPGAGPAGVRT